jgi:hypothetical protein
VWALVVLLLACAGCGSGNVTGPLSAGLLHVSDLTGKWTSFTPARSRPKVNMCGEPFAASAPLPVDTASVAWAVDPNNGPIIGERIERFANSNAAISVLDKQLGVPCDYTSADGSRWHTERLSPPTSADGSRMFLVTSRDRPDSFTYQAAVINGPVAILLVLNSRTANRHLLDDVLATAMHRAKDAGLTS